MALRRRRQQHGVTALVFSRLEWSLWHPVRFGSVQEPEEFVESITFLQGKAHSKAINSTAPAGIPPRFGDHLRTC
jgi:hypothetical protein